MEKLLIFLGAIALIVLIAFLCALPTMWLWNWLMPALFGLIKINFWKALGINLLCTILFKSSTTSSK
jgi:small-conductance mechanosensitive channel